MFCREQPGCVRVKETGQVQAKRKTSLKWEGTVILGKSPESLVPPAALLAVAGGWLQQVWGRETNLQHKGLG